MFNRVDFAKENIDSTAFYNSQLDSIRQQRDTVKLKPVLDRLYSEILKLPVEDSVNSFMRLLDSLHQKLQIDDTAFTMRYQTYIIRTQDPVTTFKNLVVSFEAAARDTLITGVNIVAPEDNPVSMRDYWLHMQMFAWCHRKYADVAYSMHAGELAEGYVQPEELKWHIAEAVYTAGAKRIGHGVDIPYEKDNYKLLRFMSTNKIPVEINLTSNEFILGVKNDKHPILLYKRFQVPIVISTDDAGVSRSSLTEQYVLLASRYKSISYNDIKNFIYNSIEYSFTTRSKKQALKKDLDNRFKKFERYILSEQPR
jgi:adenosine deaminase